jgi:hypothetical protein
MDQITIEISIRAFYVLPILLYDLRLLQYELPFIVLLRFTENNSDLPKIFDDSIWFIQTHMLNSTKETFSDCWTSPLQLLNLFHIPSFNAKFQHAIPINPTLSNVQSHTWNTQVFSKENHQLEASLFLFISWNPWRWYRRRSRHGSDNGSSCTLTAGPIQAKRWYGYFDKHLQDAAETARTSNPRTPESSHGIHVSIRLTHRRSKSSAAGTMRSRTVSVAVASGLLACPPRPSTHPNHHPHPRSPAGRMTGMAWHEGSERRRRAEARG